VAALLALVALGGWWAYHRFAASALLRRQPETAQFHRHLANSIEELLLVAGAQNRLVDLT